jgi:hypothetical protein
MAAAVTMLANLEKEKSTEKYAAPMQGRVFRGQTLNGPLYERLQDVDTTRWRDAQGEGADDRGGGFEREQR